MNLRLRWALALGMAIALITSTMVISNNVPVAVKDGNGVVQNFATVQNATSQLIAENAICDGQAAAACATVKGSSSAAAATDSAMVVALTPNSPAVTSPQSGTLIWPPGTVPITGGGTLTTSPASGAALVAPVQIGGTVTTSPASGSNQFITSPQVGSLASIGVVGIGSTVTVSASNTSLATIVSPQVGSLQPIGVVGIGSTVVNSPSNTTLVQTGYPADTVCGTDTGTCSEIALVKRANQLLDSPLQTQSSTIAIGGVGLLAGTSGGCTSQYITASTSSIITNVKQSAGTLCWLRIINASPITATVRVYDTASVNQQAVCGGSTLPVSYDLVQPNSTSPGSVANLGPYGMAFANGLQICLTGSAGGTFGFQDQTSLTTNALFVNVGFK